MPDTGPPWNIPYADPADLVRDWPDLSEDIADAVAAGLSAANVGIGSNVVTQTMSTNFNTTSGTFVDVTGLEVTITPTSATSRVLVLCNAAAIIVQGSNTGIFVRFAATSGATDINFGFAFTTSGGETYFPTSGALLHSPGVATPVTYKVQAQRNTGSSTVTVQAPARITAIEVAA